MNAVWRIVGRVPARMLIWFGAAGLCLAIHVFFYWWWRRLLVRHGHNVKVVHRDVQRPAA